MRPSPSNTTRVAKSGTRSTAWVATSSVLPASRNARKLRHAFRSIERAHQDHAAEQAERASEHRKGFAARRAEPQPTALHAPSPTDGLPVGRTCGSREPSRPSTAALERHRRRLQSASAATCATRIGSCIRAASTSPTQPLERRSAQAARFASVRIARSVRSLRSARSSPRT